MFSEKNIEITRKKSSFFKPKKTNVPADDCPDKPHNKIFKIWQKNNANHFQKKSLQLQKKTQRGYIIIRNSH